MATKKASDTAGGSRRRPGGGWSGPRTSDEATKARGGGRVTMHLTPERLATAKRLAEAAGADLAKRGGWVKLWDWMAERAEKGGGS